MEPVRYKPCKMCLWTIVYVRRRMDIVITTDEKTRKTYKDLAVRRTGSQDMSGCGWYSTATAGRRSVCYSVITLEITAICNFSHRLGNMTRTLVLASSWSLVVFLLRGSWKLNFIFCVVQNVLPQNIGTNTNTSIQTKTPTTDLAMATDASDVNGIYTIATSLTTLAPGNDTR